MINHKEGCIWKGFEYGLTANDPYGPDENLYVSETEIAYDHNLHSIDPEKDWTIKFNFCPICGVEIKTE
jgi:hypothetical protein